jgi:VCBS repeat-containing protein
MNTVPLGNEQTGTEGLPAPVVSPDGGSVMQITFGQTWSNPQQVLQFMNSSMAAQNSLTINEAVGNIVMAPSSTAAYLIEDDFQGNCLGIFSFSTTSSGASWTQGDSFSSGSCFGDLAISSDGSTIYATSSDNSGYGTQISAISTGATKQVLATLDVPDVGPSPNISVAVRPDQNGVYLAGSDIEKINFTAGAQEGALTARATAVPWSGDIPTSIAFSPDSTRLYVATSTCADPDGESVAITAIDPDSGALITEDGLTNPINITTMSGCGANITMSADGSILYLELGCTATASYNDSAGEAVWYCSQGSVQLINTASGKTVGAPYLVPGNATGVQPAAGARDAVRRRRLTAGGR